MAVKDLKIRQGNVDIIVDIVDVGETRQFDKFGKSGRVATAIAKDDTGDIKLTLWNEQIDNVKSGDKVHITNGYVSEWQGEPQLTTGKMGKIEVVGENKETKKEETSLPDEQEDKKIYKESEKRLEEIEEKLEEESGDDEESRKDLDYDEEEIKDE